jgi:hypothetical protein
MCSLPGFSGRFCSYRKPNFPAVSGSYLPGFSGRICSYWQPNFPALSVVTCRDFLALPFLAPEGRDFPAVSVVSGRDFPAVAFLAWVIKKNSLGSRQIVLVSTAGFSVLNTEIFWREAKAKRLFSQCSASAQSRKSAWLLSSRLNWDSPPPQPWRVCSPLLWFHGGGGQYTRLLERGSFLLYSVH